MKTFLDCFPCFVNQALKAGRMATDSDEKVKQVIDRIGEMLKDIPAESTPPETGDLIYGLVRDITGNPDPYKSIKQQNIDEARALLPMLRKRVKNSDNPLLMAIRIAIAGNVMDLGVDREYDIERDLETILQQEFGIFDYEAFQQKLEKVQSVLYLGDNAGESVFDRILIEQLEKPVTYVVRGTPVINDVTYAEAISSTLNEVAQLTDNGSSAPGTILSRCSDKFVARFNSAEMIIAKGQGNYESLSGTKRPVFYLLKAKCKIIANDLGVKLNDIVLAAAQSGKHR